MNIAEVLAKLKQEPGFTEHVGMILVHNGVVRGWSRQNRQDVSAVEVTPDHEKLAAIAREIEAKPGIFRAMGFAEGGHREPGDDLLWLVVAGDVRENVKPALAEFLDRAKSEAISKIEIPA
ncbi:MAG: molybdenum cofactor biosynthesis protein MoaE [Desulfovibrionaceae bacterium]